MDILFFLLACVSLILLIISLVKPKLVVKWGDRSRAIGFLTYGIAIVIFMALFGVTIKPTDRAEPKSVASNEQTQTNNKEVDTKAVAEQKAKEEAEAKVKAEAEVKKWEEFANKNTKQLSAGEHVVGTHLDAGVYDITFNGNGNFIVNGSDGSLISNEVGGSDMGVSKYRAILSDGCKIKLSGMSINVKPIQRTLMSYSNISIYAGYWIVGQDMTKGRYKATPDSGAGNFIIYDKSGRPKTNEILGDNGVKEVVVNLEDDDIVTISSLNQVNFIPTN